MDLNTKHLHRDRLIGEGEECDYKTLIDYTLDRIPELDRKIKKAEDNNA